MRFDRARKTAGTTLAVLGMTLAAARGEEQPVFKASELLKPAALRGADFTVDEDVPLVNGRYTFTLKTPYGPITAQGIDMLELRIGEIPAIQQAHRMVKESPELAGVKDNIKQTGKGLKSLVTDPVDAIGSIPKGIGRKAKALTKKETYKSGGSESRRELAVQLGCDPETRNPVLDKLMDQISLRRSAGKGIMAVATFGLTGGAALAAKGASAMRTSAQMQETLRTTPLYKINENTRAELVQMGVEPAAAKMFTDHPQFTTLQRLQFMDQLKRFTDVRGGPRAVSMALRTRSEADALGLIHALELLGDVAKPGRVTELLDMDLPAVRLADARIVAGSGLDYLLPGKELDHWIIELNRKKTQDSGPVVLIVAGRVSSEAREALAAVKFEVIENGRAERMK